MPDIWCSKNYNHCLEPADQVAKDYLKKLKAGETILVNVKKPRNIKFHRKYFALLSVAWENQEKYEAFEAMRKEVIMRAGWFVEHHHLTGAISYEAKSIAFHNMDELEFDDLYNKSIDVILKHFMPGGDADALQNAVDQILGFDS